MRKINEYSKKRMREYPLSILFSLFFIAFGFLLLKFYQNSSDSNHLFGATVLLLIGIISIVANTRLFLRNYKKNKKIKNAMEFGSAFKATIEGERKIGTFEGNGITCLAEVNGKPYEFVSEPVSRYFTYACQELDIKTITVYVNIRNPEEYVVDTREIEDRIVDLTK